MSSQAENVSVKYYINLMRADVADLWLVFKYLLVDFEDLDVDKTMLMSFRSIYEKLGEMMLQMGEDVRQDWSEEHFASYYVERLTDLYILNRRGNSSLTYIINSGLGDNVKKSTMYRIEMFREKTETLDLRVEKPYLR